MGDGLTSASEASQRAASKRLLFSKPYLPRRPGLRLSFSLSAVGYYGPRGDEVLNEDAAPGSDYLARACFDWEASTAPVVRMGVRRPVIRTGIVLTTEGGAFPKILLPSSFSPAGQWATARSTGLGSTSTTKCEPSAS